MALARRWIVVSVAASFCLISLLDPGVIHPAHATPSASSGVFELRDAALVSRKAGDVSVLTEPGVPVAFTIFSDLSAEPNRSIVVADDNGLAAMEVTAFKQATVVAVAGDTFRSTRTYSAASQFAPLDIPGKLPRPKQRFFDPPGVGKGPNAKVTKIGSRLRKKMTGVSWRPGCIPFDQLRQVNVNYIDPEGFVRRGTIIVRNDVAKRVARLFSHIYRDRYRLTSMHPAYRYGKSKRGPGANDYAMMRASNTSAFNCRYAVGFESSAILSPHWGGRAIDINPNENPYISRAGTFPHAAYTSQSARKKNPMALNRRSSPVRHAIRMGWDWWGPKGDWHHFEMRR